MAVFIYYVILAWRIPWTEQPGRLQLLASHRVRYDQRISMHACTQTHLTCLLLKYLTKLEVFFFFFLILFFKFYFIFKLYITVLVLPNIKMNPPQVYMCSPSWKFIHFGCLLFNSPFPDPSASDNHKFDLFFYKFVCCQSIIDLQHYISFCYIT